MKGLVLRPCYFDEYDRRRWYVVRMADVDLSNPDFEPTDEDLQGLATRAFRDVPQQNAKMLEEVYQRIQQYAAAAAASVVANKP